MVGIVIAFPGIVTGNVSKAKASISGTGADEIRRQLETPTVTDDTNGTKPETPAAGQDEDPAANIERMLKEQK